MSTSNCIYYYLFANLNKSSYKSETCEKLSVTSSTNICKVKCRYKFINETLYQIAKKNIYDSDIFIQLLYSNRFDCDILKFVEK